MKRKISLLLVMMLVLCTITNLAGAEETALVETTSAELLAENEPLMLSIEDAVRMATENSREMWKIDDALAQVKEARKDAKDAKNLAKMISEMSLPELEAVFGPDFDVTSNQVERILAKNDYYII